MQKTKGIPHHTVKRVIFDERKIDKEDSVIVLTAVFLPENKNNTVKLKPGRLNFFSLIIFITGTIKSRLNTKVSQRAKSKIAHWKSFIRFKNKLHVLTLIPRHCQPL